MNVRKVGSGAQSVKLDDASTRALIALVARDLGCSNSFGGETLPELYAANPPSALQLTKGPVPLKMFEQLLDSCGPNTDTYFECVGHLHRARLKYRRILAGQPKTLLDEVGPRSLLEYGLLPTRDLAALLLLRKWVMTVDNRAGQETGNLFQPIVARALGGVAYNDKRSPVHRRSGKGRRQVDCLLEDDDRAYEIKIRVSIAASGQGRWGEELSFPEDCKASGFTPVLVVFDPTPNKKLSELAAAFEAAGGDVYLGEDAWNHLEGTAGVTMGRFLEKYVRTPLQEVIESTPQDLPNLTLTLAADRVVFALSGGTAYEIPREPDPELAGDMDRLPDDGPTLFEV